VLMREVLRGSDVPAIEEIVRTTGMFSAEEVAIAVELLVDGVTRGEASDYRFVVAEGSSGVVGYACYGSVPCTVGSWDLYWIAVKPGAQGGGIGRRLVSVVEARVAAAKGRLIFVDTSGRADYAPTRAFYEACGYAVACRVADFYAPGDDKVVYVKAPTVT
jgi:ribosomal protein S18 acetylase RimI-like enzyme